MSETNALSTKTAPITADDAKTLVDRLDQITLNYRGQFDELEAAIGMYMVGRHMGWKVLVLIHNKRTIRKYEGILGIDVREEFPEEGPLAHKSLGLAVVKKIGNFWKAVSGELKDEELKAKRRELDH